jgi:nitrogen fixation NifU-like protein
MSENEDLRELYRQTVLEHSRRPHNFRRLDSPDRSAEGHNALCGDKVQVYVNLDGDRIDDLAYEAAGCAISLASASIMSDQLCGLDENDALERVTQIDDALGSPETDASLPGDMAALCSVRRYPSRIRCALLPWHTLRAALEEDPGAVSTED